MEPQKRLLTLKEVAKELRCSKAHVSNVVNDRVRGVARLTHIAVGRRPARSHSFIPCSCSPPKGTATGGSSILLHTQASRWPLSLIPRSGVNIEFALVSMLPRVNDKRCC